MDLSVGNLAVLTQVVATLALAAFVLALDFRQPVHRAFALLLLLRGLLAGLFLFGRVIDSLPGRLRFYCFIAVPFAALHFALAYRRRHAAGTPRGRRPQWPLPLAIAMAALAFVLAYALDHALFFTPPRTFGPFAVFVYLAPPAYAAIALLFAVEHLRGRPVGDRNAFLLAMVGFSLEPLFYAGFRLIDLAIDFARGAPVSPTFLSLTVEASAMAATILLLVTLFVLVDRQSRRQGRPDVARRLRLLWLAVLATAAACAALEAVNQDVNTEVLVVVDAVWALGVPVLVTYALVKHRLFDVEVKLRFAVKGSTVAAAFLAVFFVVSQIAQNFLSTRGGLIVGGVVTGLVLFAIQPLQHFADRLARRAVPGGPARGPHAERARIYREQLEIAWADGRLTPKERLLFARLQERLGIPADEAARLETEVLAELAKPAKATAMPKATA